MANTVLKGQASTVSIYRWLYAGFLLYGDRSLLRHKGRRRVQRKEGKAKKYTAGRSVHTRPASIESRGEFGHFEVDTVESGRNGTGCVFIIAGRKKRVLSACRDEFCAGAELHKILKKFVKVFSQEQSNHIPEIVETDPAGIRSFGSGLAHSDLFYRYPRAEKIEWKYKRFFEGEFFGENQFFGCHLS